MTDLCEHIFTHLVIFYEVPLQVSFLPDLLLLLLFNYFWVCRSSLHILEASPLSLIYDERLPFCGFLFHSLNGLFDKQKSFVLIQSNLINFSFINSSVYVLLNMALPTAKIQRYLLISFRSLYLFCLLHLGL